jgi:lysophospholipase L1-like esterase
MQSARRWLVNLRECMLLNVMELPLDRSTRIRDFAIAGSIVVLAVMVSPIGIRLVTGRLDLTPRIIVLSLTFAVFLLVVAAAVPSRGRIKVVIFYLLMLSFPLVLLAGVEAAAIAFHLADRIAPLEDMSTLANRNGWPAHFMSAGRKVEKDGLQLYRPWEGQDIVINDLGLRTAPPTPKRSGEWRIAITGGSVAFGWRMRDADTIAVQVQEMLRARGLSNVTVYNFGIDSAVVAEELNLLKQFRKIYDIDQVIFLTGTNDVTLNYMRVASPPDGFGGLTAGINAFELLKVVGRLSASHASPDLLQRLDNELLPDVARRNSLLDGLIAADEYCRTSKLLCDVVLQPELLKRKTPIGPEIRLAQTLREVYPRYDELFTAMYRTAMSAGLPVHDSSDVFDQSAEPYFIDVTHLNEAGNRRLAAKVTEIALPRIPSAALDTERAN